MCQSLCYFDPNLTPIAIYTWICSTVCDLFRLSAHISVGCGGALSFGISSESRSLKHCIPDITSPPQNDNSGIIIRNLQNLWLNCDKSINKLFFIDNKCRLCPNTAAYTKLINIQAFYEEVYQNICDTDKYIKTISSWIPGELSPDITFLDSVSGKNSRTIDEFIDCYKNKLLEPSSIYDEFIRIYKSECSKIYSGDELKSKLNLKKAKNIRKSTINNAIL